MGVITPSTFDPLKRRCNVRLQQGVPIVDADLNELDDIRKFELRAYLKWFVGDGVPEGNDGFRIDSIGPGEVDDVLIYSGFLGYPLGWPVTQELRALHRVGRCIVDGLDVIIDSSIRFKAQPLYGVNGLGATRIDAIPAIDGEVIVYLDVWERLVTIQEEPALVHTALGTESCVRMKREWAVRARAGTTAPTPGGPDYVTGHSYCGLAIITRRLVSGSPAPITQADIRDIRARALLMPPSTLIPDVLGVQAQEYRRGEGRPLMSMRSALNALVRGDVPAGPSFAITPPGMPSSGSMSALVDRDGSVEHMWTSYFVSGADMRASRVARNLEAPVSPTDLQVTSNGLTISVNAARLPNGDLVVVSTQSVSGDINAFFRRASTVEGLPAATDTQVSFVPSDDVAGCFVAVSGSLAGGGDVVFFWVQQNIVPSKWLWRYRRRRYTSSWAEADATWVDASGQTLSSTLANPGGFTVANAFHAAVDGDGVIWIAFKTEMNDTQYLRLIPSGTTPTINIFTPGGGLPAAQGSPFVLVDGSSAVWFFTYGEDATESSCVLLRRHVKSSGTWGFEYLLDTSATAGARWLCAARDRLGGIWLFWTTISDESRILFRRRDPETGQWGSPRQLGVPSDTNIVDSLPCAVIDEDQVLSLFWQRQTGNPAVSNEIYCKQMLIEI